MTVPTKTPVVGDVMESVILKGDLSKLTPEERVRYYNETCRSLGLNPLTRPFEYVTLSGKQVLYARRDAADQLRKIHGIDITIVSQEMHDGLLTVHVRAKDKGGRVDEDLGVVAFGDQLRGEARANVIMKAVTKAKRRVTLSLCGLGWLDETEVEDIPAAQKQPPAPAPNVLLHDPTTGEITSGSPAASAPEGGTAPAQQSEKQEAGAVLSIEDMAREAAARGEKVFRQFYRNRSKVEQSCIAKIGEELRNLMNEEKADADAKS